ncbi:MAG TPA: protein translocase subunit SecD [Alphaproteobacteria bacterium]|nr:protein translocase subunit SecD [Alphaproteobacteria bacterium]USO05968.1 MAG: protein translocase subunit SecD [Rhodospirillales bacterium]HOO81169.1 protein translocase subunit SecD [Alphaproteobacteria bacterium]
MIQIAPWKIVLTLLVCALAFLYALPNAVSEQTRSWMQINLPGWAPNKAVNLGLDLRGGAHLLYEVDVDLVLKERADSMLQDLRKSLREDKIGYTRIGVIPGGVRLSLKNKKDGEGARRILRKLERNLDIDTSGDGLKIDAALDEAGKKALYDHTLAQSIEIVRRRIDELGTTEPIIQRQSADRILIQAPGADAESLKAIIGTTAKLNFHLVKDPGTSGASKTYPLSEDPTQKVTVERRALITGDMLENAAPSFDQGGQPVISFRLNNTGARRFCDVTRKNVNKPFAIVLDNEVLSAPVIREPICGGRGQISGGFSVQEANDLALLLRAGALPAPMNVVEERTVGPSLGADSVEAGKKASLIGLALVLVFMALAYGGFGLMADVALIVNVALIFAILSGLQATLTLPGIAGIVLTIGMAVDANVLIFERIREELRAGRSAISAIDAGYARAMGTIIDSNLTTLIAALILFSLGTGPIKGFAVTLGVGIVTSFFTAIMVTRLMVVAWLKKTKPSTVPV